MSSEAIAEGLFTWPTDDPALIGAACRGCDAVTFPRQRGCPRCGEDMVPRELPREGTLWSFTVQGFRPKTPPYRGPEEFVPFGVGYVDLGSVIVQARLTENDPDLLRIGMPMRLVIEDCGEDRVSYAFRPVAEGERP